MLSRYEIILRILNSLGVYEQELAREIDSGKEGTFKSLQGIIYSYRRIRESADRLVNSRLGV